jgi:hypothetical protein
LIAFDRSYFRTNERTVFINSLIIFTSPPYSFAPSESLQRKLRFTK